MTVVKHRKPLLVKLFFDKLLEKLMKIAIEMQVLKKVSD